MRHGCVFTFLLSAFVFVHLGFSIDIPEDLNGVGSEEALAGLDASSGEEEETEDRTEHKDLNEPDYKEVLEQLKKLRAKAEASRKGPATQDDPWDPPAVYFWGTGGNEKDAPLDTAGQTGLGASDDDDTAGGTNDSAENMPSFPDDVLNEQLESLHQWKGQIVGRFGVRGMTGSAWNQEPTLTEALSLCVINVTRIDASQLEFDQAKDDGDFGSNTGRRLLSRAGQQFSLGYTINLLTDQSDEASTSILKALEEEIPSPIFIASFKASAKKLNEKTIVETFPNGALSFVATARVVDTPYVAPPSPDLSDEGDVNFAPVGLNDWGVREYGTMRLHNEVSTSIKLVVEGEHVGSLTEQQPLFKAATALALKTALRIDFDKHLEVTLKSGGQPEMGDWGGGSQLSQNMVELSIDLKDVASALSEHRLNSAIVKIVQDHVLIEKLCDLAGGSWCLGADIRVAALEPPPEAVDDLRSPFSKKLNGISNVLLPYFN